MTAVAAPHLDFPALFVLLFFFLALTFLALMAARSRSRSPEQPQSVTSVAFDADSLDPLVQQIVDDPLWQLTSDTLAPTVPGEDTATLPTCDVCANAVEHCTCASPDTICRICLEPLGNSGFQWPGCLSNANHCFHVDWATNRFFFGF